MTGEAGREVTPARMRDLAAQAEALAAAITAAHEDFRAVSTDYDHPVRRAGFRLDEAAGQARAVAGELQETAADLARIAARPDGSCSIPWGVCPEHGNTLTSTGGATWCTVCGRRWSEDHAVVVGVLRAPVTDGQNGQVAQVLGFHRVPS